MRIRIHNAIQQWKRPLRLLPSMVRRRTRREDGPIDPGAAPTPPRDPELTLHYPTTSLGRVLDQTADRFGDAPAIVYGESRWTYGELLRDVNRLAAGLARMGVGKGDRVMMTLPNCPEFVTSFMAVQKLGAIVVNAGPLMGADDLRSLCAMTRPRMLIGLDLQAPMLTRIDAIESLTAAVLHDDRQLTRLWVSLKDYQKIWKRLGYRARLWQTRQSNGRNGHDRSIEELMAEAPSRPPTVAPDPDQTAVLQPTGGTTGSLKVAQLSHRNLLANATQISSCVHIQAGQDRILAVLPMFHVYGLTTCLITSLFHGAAMVPLTRVIIAQILDAIATNRPTVIPLAPAIIEPICDALDRNPRPDVIEAVQSAVVTSGAAPLTVETSQRFERLTGTRIAQGYGLTEAAPVTHANPTTDPRPGSIGLPLADTAVRIVDTDDPTRDAEPDAAGELWISGPQVMSGYFENASESQRVLKTDATGRTWLRTGDVVRVDDDGYFHVLDRCKDMINCGGLKVYPGKVECVLKQHPKVVDAAVIGRPDAVKTEIVVAIVVLEPNTVDDDALRDDLRTHCRRHLAFYEVPRRVKVVESLPRTSLGKLQKYRLRDDADSNVQGAADKAAPHPAKNGGTPRGNGKEHA